jgi:hypothetical protein
VGGCGVLRNMEDMAMGTRGGPGEQPEGGLGGLRVGVGVVHCVGERRGIARI